MRIEYNVYGVLDSDPFPETTYHLAWLLDRTLLPASYKPFSIPTPPQPNDFEYIFLDEKTKAEMGVD